MEKCMNTFYFGHFTCVTSSDCVDIPQQLDDVCTQTDDVIHKNMAVWKTKCFDFVKNGLEECVQRCAPLVNGMHSICKTCGTYLK